MPGSSGWAVKACSPPLKGEVEGEGEEERGRWRRGEKKEGEIKGRGRSGGGMSASTSCICPITEIDRGSRPYLWLEVLPLVGWTPASSCSLSRATV